MAASGVEFAEIGFRLLETKTFKGACAYSRDSFIKNLQIPNSLKIGVMVNASELLNYKMKNPIKNIKLLFKNKKSKVKLVRIACHYFEIEKTLPVSIKLKKKVSKLQNTNFI
jgi:4-hydroxy 2-oxovalerate aldolase